MSEVKPLEIENESSKNPLLDHVPVVGVLNLAQDKGKLEQYFQSCTFRPTFDYITELWLCSKYSNRLMLDFLKVHFRIAFYFLSSSRSSRIRKREKHWHKRTFQKRRNARIATENSFAVVIFLASFSLKALFVIQICQLSVEVNNIVHSFNSQQVFVWT